MNNENWYHIGKVDFFVGGGKPTVHIGFNSPLTIDGVPGTESFAPGSTAFNPETGTAYMLKSDGTWGVL